MSRETREAENTRRVIEDAAKTGARFLTTPFYLIFVEGDDGEFYFPETRWPQLTSIDETEKRIMDVLDCAADMVVLYSVPGAPTVDVSQQFAELVAARLARQDWDAEGMVGITFVSRRLTNEQMESIIRGA